MQYYIKHHILATMAEGRGATSATVVAKLQRRTRRNPLVNTLINSETAERYDQKCTVRRISEALEKDNQCKTFDV